MKAIQFKKITTVQRGLAAKKEEVDDSDSGIEIVSVNLKAHAHARTGRRQVEESGNRKGKTAIRSKPELQKSGNAESVLSSAQTRRNRTGEILTPPSESELLNTGSTRVQFNSREGQLGSAVVSEPDGTQPVPVEDILKDDIFSGEPYFEEPERTDDEIRQLIHGSTYPAASNFLVNTLVEFSGGDDTADGQGQIFGNSGLNQLLTPMSNTPRKRHRDDNEDHEVSINGDTDTNGTGEDSEEDDWDADENIELEVPAPAPKRRRMAVEDHSDPGPLSNKAAMEANDGIITRTKAARRGMPPGTGERTGSMLREQPTVSNGKTSVNKESNTNRNNTAPRSPVPLQAGMIIEAPESCLRCQLRGTKCLYVNSLLPGSRGSGGPTFKRSACAACAQRHEKCEWNVEKRASGSQNRLDQVRADVKRMIEEERVRLEEIQVRLETLESTLEVLEGTITKS